MSLRPYQSRETGALGAVERAWRAGVSRQLVSMATGLGKTVFFSNLTTIGFRRLLVVAHREELLDQAAAKLRTWNPGLEVQVDQGDRWAAVENLAAFDGDPFGGTGYAVCASVATIGRAGSRRLTRYPKDLFDAVVLDECHHASSQSYQSVIGHFQAGQPGGPLLLGVTATPFRADGADLSKVFEKIVFSYELPDAIRDGYLVDIRAVAVETKISLDEVSATREDFRQGELEDAVNTPGRNGKIVKAYLERAAGRKGIVFCAGVQHSRDLCEAFRAAGVSTEHLDGTTPADERAGILRRLHTGETRLVCNVGVLTEGFDEPSISVVILARPTKSGVLYAQMLGRGTRLFEGKADLLVIDVADVTSKHSLVSAAALFGLPSGLDLEGKSASAARKKVKELVQEGLPFDELAKAQRIADLDKIANHYRAIKLFWQPKPAPEVQGISALAWVSCGDGELALRAGDLRAHIRIDLIGHAHLVIRRRFPRTELGLQVPDTIELDATFPRLSEAVVRADGHLTSSTPKAFTNPNARWRKEPASDKQLALLKRYRVPHLDGLTKGEAGILLDKVFARRRAS